MFLTDCKLSPSSFAISLLLRPDATPRITSRSRGVRIKFGDLTATRPRIDWHRSPDKAWISAKRGQRQAEWKSKRPESEEYRTRGKDSYQIRSALTCVQY